MTIRETIRRRIDDWRKPPDVVPLAPTWNDRARAGISWALLGVFISVLRLVLWLSETKKP
jgi:hypothetical protein